MHGWKISELPTPNEPNIRNLRKTGAAAVTRDRRRKSDYKEKGGRTVIGDLLFGPTVEHPSQSLHHSS